MRTPVSILMALLAAVVATAGGFAMSALLFGPTAAPASAARELPPPALLPVTVVKDVSGFMAASLSALRWHFW